MFAFCALFISCSKAQDKNDKPAPSEKNITVNIDLSKTYQVIDNFGASDAWSCQFAGNWPDAKKNAIADLLFSTDTTSGGKPQGIGLSLWRFNIGAGSAEKGAQSGIADEWRRAESFLNNDGTYNWQKQAGQMWFLKAAQARGVNRFLGFTNSPPVQFTRNGKAYASSGSSNLAAGKFSAFAGFLTDVVKGIEEKAGIELNYISPVNEPQWDWSDGGQEGSPFRNNEIAGIVKSLDSALTKKNLSSRIIVPEAGQIDFLYSDNGKPGRGNQIDAFFNTSSPDYTGNLPRVDKIIAGHSYFTTSPFNQAIAKRRQLAAKIASISGLGYWMSEYCILGDNAGEIDGNKRDPGINPALYIARAIYTDLALANASAWQWWLAISPYDYKDGLIGIDKNKTNGDYYPTKMLWAMGNYSRFIRPGSVRVDVSSTGLTDGDNLLLISSYKNEAAGKLITVVVNSDTKPVNLKLQVQNGTVSEVRPYITSAETNLSPSDPVSISRPVIIQPRSVTTLVSVIQ